MILGFVDVILGIIAFVIILAAIILIHEGGHFFFAVRAGILCREYAFGMGPLLWKKKKGETTYSIRAIPIGGFCAICGEEEELDPLDGLSEIRFDLEDGVINKIYLPTDGKNEVHLFDDKPLYKMVNHDLFDKDDTGKLYITILKDDIEVEVPVKRDACFVYGVGRHNNENVSLEKRLEKNVEEYQIGPHDRTLDSKKFHQKFLVMFGGPLMNFVLAILAFFVSFLITGVSDTSTGKLSDFGFETEIVNVQKDKDNTSITDIINLGEDAIGKKYNLYGYVSSVNNSIVEITTDELSGAVYTVRLNNGETLSKYSFVLLNGSVAKIKIGDDDILCLDGATVSNEIRIISPAYLAGLREGDIITKLECGELVKEVKTWDDISLFMEEFASLQNKGAITVSYKDNNDNSHVVQVNPMVYIYSVSMVQDIGSTEVMIDDLNVKSKAYVAGLRKGDVIVSVKIGDVETEITNWYQVYDAFNSDEAKSGKQDIILKVKRDGNILNEEIILRPYSEKLFRKTQSVGIVDVKIGVSSGTTRNIFKVIKATFLKLFTSIAQLFNTLGLLIFSSEVGIRDLSGPVGIFSMTKDAVSGGVGYLFYWMGFLSANVGFMNLLPIPALDGGRIVFLIIEFFRRKPLSSKVKTIAINVTYYALIALIIYVSFNDILRLFK